MFRASRKAPFFSSTDMQEAFEVAVVLPAMARLVSEDDPRNGDAHPTI